jgi:adenylate cyclase class 2
MQYEVELKYRVTDQAALLEKFNQQGCRWDEPVRQRDLYWSHPARDFRQTDEALRLRQSGEETYITYKGPRLDKTTKTRREIELPIAPGPQGWEAYCELLTLLGFREVLEVDKTRLPGMLPWEGVEVHIALDTVEQLGEFVELELIATADALDATKLHLHSLAQTLELAQPEMRGYLHLLLAQQGEGG